MYVFLKKKRGQFVYVPISMSAQEENIKEEKRELRFEKFGYNSFIVSGRDQQCVHL